MRFSKIQSGVLLVTLLLSLAATTGNGHAQQNCKQVCVHETVKCVKYGNGCVQYQYQCASYRDVCTARDRSGGCIRHQQVCAQYKQACTRYQQVCLQQQKVCSNYQTVCSPSNQAGAPGKAFQQLQGIGKGRDSIFDGGPGSTLNRR